MFPRRYDPKFTGYGDDGWREPLYSAKALGLTIPPSVLVRADEVIY